MYDLSTEVVKPGCHFSDLIRHRKETGSFDGDVDEFCSTDPAQCRAGQGHPVRAWNAADGRSFQIVNKPLAQGGWVATIEDITERAEPRTGARPQLSRSCARSSTTSRRRSPSRTCATGVTCWSTGWPRPSSGCRAMPSSARPRSTCSRRPPPISSPRTTTRPLQSADGLFLDEHPWQSQALGQRFITSRRIGIPDQAGETRYIINVVEDVTERRRADENASRIWRITTR